MEQDKRRLPPGTPYTRKEYEQSIERLRQSGTFDVDAFLSGASINELLSTPMGPSRDCLSPDDIAEYIENEHVRPMADKIKQMKIELVVCEDCRDNVTLYKRLQSPARDPEQEAIWQRLLQGNNDESLSEEQK